MPFAGDTPQSGPAQSRMTPHTSPEPAMTHPGTNSATVNATGSAGMGSSGDKASTTVGPAPLATASHASHTDRDAAPLPSGVSSPAAVNRRGLALLIGTLVVVAVIIVALGVAVSWGLSAILALILVPGGCAMAVIARNPELTGNRSMFGVSDPATLLDPLTGGRGTATAPEHDQPQS